MEELVIFCICDILIDLYKISHFVLASFTHNLSLENQVINVTYSDSEDFTTFEVNLSDHRILAAVLRKWLSAVLKSPANTRYRGITVVGVSVAEQPVYRRHSLHLLTLCVGSHSLLFLLPKPYDRQFKNATKHLSKFFRSSAVKTVGFDADRIGDLIQSHYDFEIKNLFDVRYDVVAPELWLRRRRSNNGGPEFDVRRLDLDQLAAATMVVGEDMEVIRPMRIKMFDQRSHFYCYGCGGLRNNCLYGDMIKFCNLDTYLLFLIASEFARTFVGDGGTRFFSSFYWPELKKLKKKKRKKKKKKMKKKNQKNEGDDDQSNEK